MFCDIPDAATALFQNPVIPRTVKLQPRLMIRSMSCYCNMPTPVAAMPMAVAVQCRPKLGKAGGSDGPFGSGSNEDFWFQRSTEMVVPCYACISTSRFYHVFTTSTPLPAKQQGRFYTMGDMRQRLQNVSVLAAFHGASDVIFGLL